MLVSLSLLSLFSLLSLSLSSPLPLLPLSPSLPLSLSPSLSLPLSSPYLPHPVKSETFDHFMTMKFASFKRYGLEGAESVMAGLESLFIEASNSGIDDIVIGMPHRGRLNILVGLLDYPARSLFSKVKGKSDIPPGYQADDDVVSHIAQSVTKRFTG